MKRKVVVAVRNHKKAENYVSALKTVGVTGEKIEVITAEDEPAGLEKLASEALGLVLCGGPDLEPWRYGEKPRQNADLRLVPELDRIEWALLEGAQIARTPIWALCRGMQAVNVFLGGTLWQDLPSQFPSDHEHDIKEPKDFLAHHVEVTNSSTRFGSLLAEEEAHVNSRHHQAVKDLAPELHAVAYAPDGVLEVAEYRDSSWWLRAVQWHPENLLELPLQRLLWQEFVEEAGANGRPDKS